MEPVLSKIPCSPLNSSVKQLQDALVLASARARVRRDHSQSGSEPGETLDPVLGRLLSDKLDSLELIPGIQQERASVIARTPQRLSPQTSTPSTSPQPPPLPARQCQSLGPIRPPPVCSPSCSELSSIDGEVFTESEFSESRLFAKAPGSSSCLQVPHILVTAAMEDAEKEIAGKNRVLCAKMRNFNTNCVNETNVTNNTHKEKIEKVEDLRDELVEEIEKLLIDQAPPPEKALEWRSYLNKVESDVMSYCNALHAKVIEVKSNSTLPSTTAISDASRSSAAASDNVRK